MTIRAPKPEDAAAVAALYNHYVLHSTASFETEPLDAEQMRSRLESATARLVCDRERAIVGFGYTHDWKERAAYRHTQEVTVYVAPDSTGLGIGRRLVERLVAAQRRPFSAVAGRKIRRTAENRADFLTFAAGGSLLTPEAFNHT